jgi:NAD+ synthase
LNKEILNEITKQDYNSIKDRIEKFLVNEVNQRGVKGVIFGSSGGIDSAVVAALCSNVLKEKSLALIMPDSKVTPEKDTEDGTSLVKKLGIDYKIIDINSIHSEFSKFLEHNDFALGNLKARIRASVLYYYATVNNYLVLGTSDKSEFFIGYFTKYGDGAADLEPIVSLYKTQLREFAKILDVPSDIIAKKSSPQLWADHTAEGELGISYEEIDSILYCLIDKGISLQETVKVTQIDEKSVNKVFELYKKSEHKRVLPKAC